MAFSVEEYVREDGSIPYRMWFDRLDAHAAAKVAVAMRAKTLHAEYKTRKAAAGSVRNRKR